MHPPTRPTPRTVYHVVEHNPQTREDFFSDEETGLPAASYETPRHRTGMSSYDRLSDARGVAKLLKRRRQLEEIHIAAVPIAPGGPFRVEQSGPDRHHYTLWGDPDELAAQARIVETI
jgi:hypothetical protein